MILEGLAKLHGDSVTSDVLEGQSKMTGGCDGERGGSEHALTTSKVCAQQYSSVQYWRRARLNRLYESR